jgi:tetratricopeptide (TPR) repeat protein
VTQTAESYLALSLQRYREERYAESIAACRAPVELRADYAEAWNNICAAYNKLGRHDEAAAACEQALRYKPNLQLARNNLFANQQRRHISISSRSGDLPERSFGICSETPLPVYSRRFFTPKNRRAVEQTIYRFVSCRTG